MRTAQQLATFAMPTAFEKREGAQQLFKLGCHDLSVEPFRI